MRCFPLLLLLLATPYLTAQQLVAPLLSGSWQSTYHNPAMGRYLTEPLTVGLPGLANDLRLENIGYRNLRERRGDERVLRLDRWAGSVAETNAAVGYLSTETLGLAYRRGPYLLSLYHRLRTRGVVDYPGTLVELAARGNAAFIGQTVELAPQGELISFQELGLGLSYDLDERFSVALRVKYLAGTANIRIAEDPSLGLTTGEENFALTLVQDVRVQTVGTLNYQSLDAAGFGYDPYRLDLSSLFGSNRGLAIDLGATAELGPWHLQASLTDLAAGIDWREDITTLTFSGSQQFSGLDVLQDLLRRDSISLEGAVDSLLVTFEPTQDATGYRSRLGPTLYIGGEYAINERLTAGGLVALQERLGDIGPSVALTGRYAVKEWLQLGLSLDYRVGIRAGASVFAYATPGPVQLFARVDGALAGFRLGAALSLASARGARRSAASAR